MQGNVVNRRVAVVAVGGNSLITDVKHQTVPDQIRAARKTCRHIVGMIEKGWDVVVTHGNGPQVGFILRRSELSRHELHDVPLTPAAPTPREPSGTTSSSLCTTSSGCAASPSRRSRWSPRSWWTETTHPSRTPANRSAASWTSAPPRTAGRATVGTWSRTPAAAGAASLPRRCPRRSSNATPLRASSLRGSPLSRSVGAGSRWSRTSSTSWSASPR